VEYASLIARLSGLGLTSYEARAYVALTGRDSFTAAEVARLATLPRQRIYDVLSSLVQKGLVSIRPGEVVKYAAAEPALAIERLVEAHRRQLTELENDASLLIDQLTPAYQSGQEHTDPLQYIEVLRSVGAINARFTELQASVKREILVFTKPPYAKPPQENVEGLKVASSLAARSLYEYSVFDDEDATEGVRRFIEAGEDARFVPELPLKLVIMDEAIVMFGMEDPIAGSHDLTMMVVEHPSLASVLKVAFDGYWDRGVSFEEASREVAKLRREAAKNSSDSHQLSAVKG
jgi:HTH-type transcriptional regulator, sugar sensing transcriptional regulator